MGAVREPGSAPGVDGGAGTMPVRAGPRTPGGEVMAGSTGNGMPEVPWSIWFDGTTGTQGRSVTGRFE